MYDRDIVAAILAGDPAGFGAVYDRYGATLYAYCRSLLTVPEEAGNAVRDTFIIAISRLPHLRDPDRLRPWLYAIARNECHRHLHDRAAAEILAETNHAVTGAFDAGTHAGESGPQDLVAAALARLEPVLREIAELSLRHELDGEALAALLGVSRKQARALASHACLQFEAALGAVVTSGGDWSLCQELGSLLAGWDGEMNAALRKRLAEHIKTCGLCGVRRAKPPVDHGAWPSQGVVPRPSVGPGQATGTHPRPGMGSWPGPAPSERPGPPREPSRDGPPGGSPREGPGRRRGARHRSRPRRGSGPRHGSRPGPGGGQVPGDFPPPGSSPVRGELPGPPLPARRTPGSIARRSGTGGPPAGGGARWSGKGGPGSRPRDTRPGSFPGTAPGPTTGAAAEGAESWAVDPGDIAEHAGPFGRSGFPLAVDPPRLYRAPVRSVLALAGVSVLAVLGVAAMVTATAHEGAGSRAPALGLPAPKHPGYWQAGEPGTPRQSPAGVVPVSTPVGGTSAPAPATIRSSRSAPAGPTVTSGTLVAFPATVALQQGSKTELPAGSFTLTANDGPVSFSITVAASDAQDLSVSPETGSLPAGEAIQIIVTLHRHSGQPLDTHLSIQPGDLDITVIYRAHSR